jgi:hypothetical protein
LHFLRNDGGSANGQLQLRLAGTKTNPLGLGARVEVRVGDLHAVQGATALLMEIGLGRAKQLDSAQTVWADGVLGNQLDVSVRPVPLLLVEKKSHRARARIFMRGIRSLLHFQNRPGATKRSIRGKRSAAASAALGKRP